MAANEQEQASRRMAELEAENARLKRDLQHSEDVFNKIFHASSNVMAIHTIKEGRYIDLNDACARLGGFKREELIGRTMDEYGLIPDEELKEKVERKLREEGRVSNIESRIRTKEGEIRTVLLSADPVTINNEPCILAVSVDITERENEASALRRSEEQYRTLVENSLQGLTIIQDARIIFCNSTYAAMLGYSVEEILQLSREDLAATVHPDDRYAVGKRLQAQLEGRPIDPRFEFRGFKRDGSIIWVEAYTSIIEYNRKPAIQAVYMEITERKNAETALRESEEALKESKEYLNQIINCIGDPIFVKDREHRFVLVNDAMCAFTSLKREEMLATAGMPPMVEKLLWDKEEAVFETGRESLSEDVFDDGQGNSVTVMTKKSLLTDTKGNKQIVGVLRDITEHKRLELQFLQSQKMEAIGVLAGGVAHDFNNLLNVINGYTELMMDDVAPGEPLREELEQIRNAGQRAATLTSQLLDFGRKQILQPEIFDLNRVIADMSSMLRRMIGEDIELQFSPNVTPAMINADPAKIQQVIMNLVVNARDAMPDGGKVTIETNRMIFKESYGSEHPIAKPGPYIVLAIRDAGMGMDAATQAHIFEPFFTTKAKGKGTGLGLSTVYGVVKQSDGFIQVSSEIAKGTLIEACFPQVEGEAPITQPESKSQTELKGLETILLVEDEAAVRALTGRILRDRGYNVIEAADGNEALRASQDYDSDIHLVLTDVVMPGMGGKTLVSRLAEMRPKVKALFISGYTDDAISHHGILDSDVAFLQKPFTLDGLVRKVRNVLDS